MAGSQEKDQGGPCRKKRGAVLTAEQRGITFPKSHRLSFLLHHFFCLFASLILTKYVPPSFPTLAPPAKWADWRFIRGKLVNLGAKTSA